MFRHPTETGYGCQASPLHAFFGTFPARSRILAARVDDLRAVGRVGAAGTMSCWDKCAGHASPFLTERNSPALCTNVARDKQDPCRKH